MYRVTASPPGYLERSSFIPGAVLYSIELCRLSIFLRTLSAWVTGGAAPLPVVVRYSVPFHGIHSHSHSPPSRISIYFYTGSEPLIRPWLPTAAFG